MLVPTAWHVQSPSESKSLTDVERRLGLFSRHDCCVFMLWCDEVIGSVGQLVEVECSIVKRDRFDCKRNKKPKILTVYIDIDSTINHQSSQLSGQSIVMSE
jgi:hypothetical protein